MRGTDVFISTWTLHRSPELWDEPDKFRPDRWLRPTTNPGVKVRACVFVCAGARRPFVYMWCGMHTGTLTSVDCVVGVQGWGGYDPKLMSGLYPNEVRQTISPPPKA
jgi:hypothetical protein